MPFSIFIFVTALLASLLAVTALLLIFTVVTALESSLSALIAASAILALVTPASLTNNPFAFESRVESATNINPKFLEVTISLVSAVVPFDWRPTNCHALCALPPVTCVWFHCSFGSTVYPEKLFLTCKPCWLAELSSNCTNAVPNVDIPEVLPTVKLPDIVTSTLAPNVNVPEPTVWLPCVLSTVLSSISKLSLPGSPSLSTYVTEIPSSVLPETIAPIMSSILSSFNVTLPLFVVKSVELNLAIPLLFVVASSAAIVTVSEPIVTLIPSPSLKLNTSPSWISKFAPVPFVASV